MNQRATFSTRGTYWPLVLIFIGILLYFAKGNLRALPVQLPTPSFGLLSYFDNLNNAVLPPLSLSHEYL